MREQLDHQALRHGEGLHGPPETIGRGSLLCVAQTSRPLFIETMNPVAKGLAIHPTYANGSQIATRQKTPYRLGRYLEDSRRIAHAKKGLGRRAGLGRGDPRQGRRQ